MVKLHKTEVEQLAPAKMRGYFPKLFFSVYQTSAWYFIDLGFSPEKNEQVNDFAHIPWEDTPNLPNPPPKKKYFFLNCWWNIRGTFQGYVGEILEQALDLRG